MHDFGPGPVVDVDRDHQIGALGDRREVGWIDPGDRAQRRRRLRPVLNVIASGIQRWLDGTVASISISIASPAALHDAIACTVRKWW